MLNPTTPPEGYNLKEYLVKKYGSRALANFGSPDSPLNQAASNLGFSFSTERRVVNTTDAHRLAEFAKQQGKCDEVMKALFISYFEEAKDISQHNVLLSVAKDCNLGEDKEIVEFLNGNEFREEVKREDQRAKREMNIRGVPNIMMDQFGLHEPVILGGTPHESTLIHIFQQYFGEENQS